MISIIIPTYNRTNIIQRTITSVLNQTEKSFEIIIIDDGSDDDTGSVVENLNDGRIQYFYKKNGGAANARNLGLSKVKGEYIAFLDSDDFWPENYLEIMLSRLKHNPDYGAAYSPITLIYPDGTQKKSYKRPEGKSGWLTIDLFKNNFLCTPAILFKTSVLKDFSFDENLKVSEDSDAWLRLSLHTQFLFVPDIEAFVSISSDSLCKKSGNPYYRLHSLERFYFKSNGYKVIPFYIARRKLSHVCRRIGKSKKSQQASRILYKQAIKYWPIDIRLYFDLMKI